MKATTWIILAVIGVIMMIIGLSIAWRVEMVKQKFGTPPYTYEMEVPTTPYFLPGIGLTAVGGILIGISILGFIIGYQKEAVKEIVSTGIKEWRGKELPPPPPPPETSTCPTCGGPLTYVEQYQRWYCHKCKKYA